MALVFLASFALAGGGDKSCATKTKAAGCCSAKTTKTAHTCDPLEGKCSSHPGSTKEVNKSDQPETKTEKKVTNTTSPI